jgi:hypothetical protein
MKANCSSKKAHYGRFKSGSSEQIVLSIKNGKFLSNEGNFNLFKLRLKISSDSDEIIKCFFKENSVSSLLELTYNEALQKFNFYV